jgi:hypothetical protein
VSPTAGEPPQRGYLGAVTSTDTPRGRHRLVEPVRRRPSLLPRSLNVVGVTVGAVLVMAAQGGPDVPAPRPHPDAPNQSVSALEPVVPAQRTGRPAPIPGAPTGRDIAGAHLSGAAKIRAVDAVAATQPPGGVAPDGLFAA